MLHDIRMFPALCAAHNPVADLEGGQGARPPPFQTQAYIVYYLEGKWMNNLTKHLLNLIKKVQFFSKFSARFARPSCFLLYF